MTDYQQTLDWLFSQLPMFSRVGAAAYKPGLDTSLALDAHFGHPHRAYRTIHVAGTNGKGSVSHSLAAVLQSQGYKVGLYTSPHLADFRERIRVNGQMIPAQDVVDFVKEFRASGYTGHPSFFELTMMMAFCWFRKMEVDIAVIEVGMGGRLDSTNIINPLACVITNISKDHTQFLGTSLPQIASEKAGIIKPGIPVTVGEAEGEVKEVFRKKALQEGAPLRFAQEWGSALSSLDSVRLPSGREFSYSLRGDYQLQNLRTVLASLVILRDCGLDISDDSIARGLADVQGLTGLAGRWMRLHTAPLVIADTGHNEAGLRYNVAQMKRELPEGGRLHIVLGFVNDKDVDHILPLFPGQASYYICQASVPRAMPIEVLAEKVAARGWGFQTFPTVEKAYECALASASENDLIYVGGSTFVVADLLATISPDE